MMSLALELPLSRQTTRLRSLRPSDLLPFAAYRADPGLAEFQSWEAMSQEAAASFLREMVDTTQLSAGAWIQLAIADARSDALVGDVGMFLSEDASYAELGFTLARAGQGQGHATRAAELAVAELFRLATVHEVRAVTDALNAASVAVLQRAHFTQTGVRQAVFKGKPCTELLFARRRVQA